MIFWDTSAIAPLIVDEPLSGAVRALAKADKDMLVWWCTPIECLSAIARREREHVMVPADADRSRGLLGVLRRRWSEVLATDTVRAHAARLLRRHPLRAADALQLAAAMTWACGEPDGHRLATLDRRLAAAARGEGFAVALTAFEDHPG